ncbi:hypothetical protein [uncultured Roseobacter sp.]|uniref:hypothetical protein n=1 Tax=uncultured Roseobacter sp. TaxID=114847 RepID=UPI00262734DE|nr:hypothetical protein [uncultured Roseobacter sp.]
MLHFIKTFISVVAIAGMLWSPTPRAASAEDAAPNPASPAVDLMWNRTGLAAIFLLLVKSPQRRDYVLTLIDRKTGAKALTA